MLKLINSKHMITQGKDVDISVIIPVYNVEYYIEDCLRSLFTQTKTEGVEFILINDCTPDQSIQKAEKVIAEYPHLDVKILHHESNGGVGQARLTGTEAAQGDYMIHIDPDDSVHPKMLEGMYETAQRENADLVVCDYYLVYVNKKKRFSPNLPSRGVECFQLLSEAKLGCYVWNKMIKKSLYQRPDLRFIKGINMWEDNTYVSKVFLLAQKIVHLPEPYYFYKKRTQSISMSSTERKNLDMIHSLAEIERFIKEQNMEIECSEPLNYYKLRLHYRLLTKSPKELREQYIPLYSELEPYLEISSSSFDASSRYIYRRALKGDFFLLDIKLFIQNLKHSLFPSKRKLFIP